MANIKFFIKKAGNPTTIYLRFSVSRDVLLRKSTSLQINSQFFNSKTGKIKNTEDFTEKGELENKLENLRAFIINSFNEDSQKGIVFNNEWLGFKIDKFFNRTKEDNLTLLEDYAKHYIEKLPTKANPNGTYGVSRTTIVKYTTILRKIQSYEKSRNKKFRLSEVNIKFRDDFLLFLLGEERLGKNTAGRYIKFVKTICLDAKRNGLKVSDQLESVRGFSVKAEKIVLTFKELELIEKTNFTDDKLSNAKDWLIMGCYLGQRVSDLLRLKKENILVKGNISVIEIVQQKTKKKVSVLLHPKVLSLLEKRNGHFPKIYSENQESNKSFFNLHIKKVAFQAGLTELIQGGKVNPKTRRKESDIYPKWQLVTSHICRRSFATNYYGNIPTPLLINITGHSTEKEFLNYIGKASIDYAEQLSKYWEIENIL